MSDQVISTLFKVLFGFVLLNMIINFYLLRIKKKRIYKLLSFFWPCVMITFIFQSIFHEQPFYIALAYSVTLLPMTVFSMIGFEALNRKFPLKYYVLYYMCSLGLTVLLYKLDFGFSTFAMPLAIATGTPLLHTFIYMNIVDRKKSTSLQKLLGILYFLLPIHCINFALFRMEASTQIWGWVVAYALYDILAILLPSIALEMANLTENVRLNLLIKDRTAELEASHKENDGLLKILLHDLSGPLMVARMYLSKYKQSLTDKSELLNRTEDSMTSIESILLQTRERYQLKASKQLSLRPVKIEECFEEIESIFAEQLLKKNVFLQFKNSLPAETYVLADRVSLTYNVLSNLISNALKFSQPHSIIKVSASLKNGEIILEVADRGPGIGIEILEKLKNDHDLTSSPGSLGETGSGFGLSIVKSMVKNYGGQIEFESSQSGKVPHDIGTNVRITLTSANPTQADGTLMQ